MVRPYTSLYQVKNMSEITSATIFFIIFTWICFFIQADRDYTVRDQAVSNITYSYTQTAAKKGTINDTIYNELESKINKLGDFNIFIVAERFNGDGTVTTLMNDMVIGYDLRGNGFDIITVYVSSTKEHYLNKVLSIFQGDAANDRYRIEARAAAYIQ